MLQSISFLIFFRRFTNFLEKDLYRELRWSGNIRGFGIFHQLKKNPRSHSSPCPGSTKNLFHTRAVPKAAADLSLASPSIPSAPHSDKKSQQSGNKGEEVSFEGNFTRRTTQFATFQSTSKEGTTILLFLLQPKIAEILPNHICLSPKPCSTSAARPYIPIQALCIGMRRLLFVGSFVSTASNYLFEVEIADLSVRWLTPTPRRRKSLRRKRKSGIGRGLRLLVLNVEDGNRRYATWRVVMVQIVADG